MSWIRMAFGGVAFLGVASVGSAQTAQQGPQGAGTPPQQRAKQGEQGAGREARMTKRLFAGIELTAAQQEQLQTIMHKYAAEKQALRPADERQRVPDAAARAKMLDITTKSQADYRAILTPEQHVIFDKNAALIKERREGRLEGRAKQNKDM
ncbi:MAG: Spy/CpxP family protein refolding chaperone [Gemmatimonadaceae bacterium]|nr:Spy/CpxP family protein refolding chaperone [Gemmatimonadaceae bacterium]